MDLPKAADEPGRLEALKNYAIVDTLPETGFDEITELAAQICDCPAALVSFVDASRQWMKAKYGPLPAELSECPREISVCRATICVDDILYVPDLTKDQRFNTSPLVTDGLRLRFYCGVPLITRDGHALGSLVRRRLQAARTDLRAAGGIEATVAADHGASGVAPAAARAQRDAA